MREAGRAMRVGLLVIALASMAMVAGLLPRAGMVDLALTPLGVSEAQAATRPSSGAGERRLALVIGNAAYPDDPLVNTVNDAADMAAKLDELGFRVTKHTNLRRRALARALTDFVREARGEDGVALFYYSGHGLQVDGRNYLVPVDAEIRDALDVPVEAIAVDRLLAGLGDRGESAINLLILDACRDNPYGGSGKKGLGDKGLARVTAPSGTLILYATRPGETASDNPGGRNGLFTKHLLAAIDDPGVAVEDAFKEVARHVYRDSRKAQSPWQEGVIFGQFYFRPPAPGPVAPPPPPLRGYLQVSVSTEARVTVAGRAVGKAQPGQPLNLSRGLPVGAVEVEVGAPGHEGQTRRVTIPPNAWAQVHFTLEREAAAAPPPPPAAEPAELIVRSNVAGDTWYLDGTAVGPTGPRSHEVSAGDHVVRVEKDGYEPYEATLELQPGARRTVKVELERARLAFEPELVSIPGGCFQMGSPGSEEGRDDDERQHRICVEAFKLAKHEVTVGAFARFVAASGYKTDAERNVGGAEGCFTYDQDDADKAWNWRSWASWRRPNKYQDNRDEHPVACVSWNDAQAYIAWLNRETGRGYRLPSEAEWEYAARAGTQTARFWGEDADKACRYANVADATKLPNNFSWTERHDCADGHAFASPVGRLEPNHWGLYDMLGNVWEWTCSAYDADYGGAEQRCAGKNHAGRVALRGGSWFNNPRWVRSASRSWHSPDIRVVNLGFRLAQD